jgi:hypothetical protein
MTRRDYVPLAKVCARCGAGYEVRQSRRTSRFCSLECTRDTRTLRERFEENVMPEPNTGCWLWLGQSTTGYGALKWCGKMLRSHRLSWELHRGPIPAGLFVCHHCDNPPCCNPAHLFLGTAADNNRDRDTKGRVSRLAGDTNPSRRHPERLSRGTSRYNALLTEAAVVDIRARRARGEKLADIAQVYGIGLSHVVRIAKRRLWRHVP